jgi:hypothetical protein
MSVVTFNGSTSTCAKRPAFAYGSVADHAFTSSKLVPSHTIIVPTAPSPSSAGNGPIIPFLHDDFHHSRCAGRVWALNAFWPSLSTHHTQNSLSPMSGSGDLIPQNQRLTCTVSHNPAFLYGSSLSILATVSDSPCRTISEPRGGASPSIKRAPNTTDPEFELHSRCAALVLLRRATESGLSMQRAAYSVAGVMFVAFEDMVGARLETKACPVRRRIDLIRASSSG